LAHRRCATAVRQVQIISLSRGVQFSVTAD
jgi:hypothetical protein